MQKGTGQAHLRWRLTFAKEATGLGRAFLPWPLLVRNFHVQTIPGGHFHLWVCRTCHAGLPWAHRFSKWILFHPRPTSLLSLQSVSLPEKELIRSVILRLDNLLFPGEQTIIITSLGGMVCGTLTCLPEHPPSLWWDMTGRGWTLLFTVFLLHVTPAHQTPEFTSITTKGEAR